MAGNGYGEMKGKGKGYDDAMGHDEIKGTGYEEKTRATRPRTRARSTPTKGNGKVLRIGHLQKSHLAAISASMRRSWSSSASDLRPRRASASDLRPR